MLNVLSLHYSSWHSIYSHVMCCSSGSLTCRCAVVDSQFVENVRIVDMSMSIAVVCIRCRPRWYAPACACRCCRFTVVTCRHCDMFIHVESCCRCMPASQRDMSILFVCIMYSCGTCMRACSLAAFQSRHVVIRHVHYVPVWYMSTATLSCSCPVDSISTDIYMS